MNGAFKAKERRIFPASQEPHDAQFRIAHSVVVPVYNSMDVLPILHSRLIAVMESLRDPFELILVDDHSTDDSWTAIERIALSDHRVVAYRLERNVGQGQATMIGLRRAAGELMITLDDDLQHPPEEIPKLLAALRSSEGTDAVFGIPTEPRSSRVRRLGSWLFNQLSSALLRKPRALRNSGFRAIRRSMVERLPRDADFAPLVSTMMFVASRRVGVVNIEHHSSSLPSSRYSFWALVKLAFQIVLHSRALVGRPGGGDEIHRDVIRCTIRRGQITLHDSELMGTA